MRSVARCCTGSLRVDDRAIAPRPEAGWSEPGPPGALTTSSNVSRRGCWSSCLTAEGPSRLSPSTLTLAVSDRHNLDQRESPAPTAACTPDHRRALTASSAHPGADDNAAAVAIALSSGRRRSGATRGRAISSSRCSDAEPPALPGPRRAGSGSTASRASEARRPGLSTPRFVMDPGGARLCRCAPPDLANLLVASRYQKLRRAAGLSRCLPATGRAARWWSLWATSSGDMSDRHAFRLRGVHAPIPGTVGQLGPLPIRRPTRLTDWRGSTDRALIRDFSSQLAAQAPWPTAPSPCRPSVRRRPWRFAICRSTLRADAGHGAPHGQLGDERTEDACRPAAPGRRSPRRFQGPTAQRATPAAAAPQRIAGELVRLRSRPRSIRAEDIERVDAIRPQLAIHARPALRCSGGACAHFTWMRLLMAGWSG